MPFLAEEHITIPSTDLLSWMFDKQTYDADKPVKDNNRPNLAEHLLNIPDLR